MGGNKCSYCKCTLVMSNDFVDRRTLYAEAERKNDG